MKIFDRCSRPLLVSLLLFLPSCASNATSKLFHAIEQGDSASAKLALQDHASPNDIKSFYLPLPDPCSSSRGTTILSPLSRAAWFGNEEIAALLLEKGALLNVPPHCTPLALAVIANKPDMVRLLLRNGASPNLTRTRPLSIWARLTGENTLSVYDSRTVLMLAAALGRVDVIEDLVDGKLDVDQTDTAGRTALIYATEAGQVQSIRALLARGAAINYQIPGSGNTALLIAVLYQKTEAVRVLLSLGADPNIHYKVLGLSEAKTATALSLAGQGNQEIADLLVQAGARE